MESIMFEDVVAFIRELYPSNEFIPLHEPRFFGREKEYLNNCIDSTFVSSVGEYVDRFEKDIARFTGARHAIAVVNGTQAIYVGLILLGVNLRTEVVTQSLTFVATANAISYTGAKPIFLDVDKDTLGLSPTALKKFLKSSTEIRKGACWNKVTHKRIAACVPMHTFGHPCRITEIREICLENHIELIEDAAESLGSFYKGVHTGRFGKLGVFSFNGNKIITTGGGGMIITDDSDLAFKAKHLTTTAKTPHEWEFNHDEVGFNFRMPNLNAALGVAQMEQVSNFLRAKRKLASLYNDYFSGQPVEFLSEPENAESNYWLNAITFKSSTVKNSFLQFSNDQGVMTRPVWVPMHRLPMYENCICGDLSNTMNCFDCLVNIPSSVRVD